MMLERHVQPWHLWDYTPSQLVALIDYLRTYPLTPVQMMERK